MQALPMLDVIVVRGSVQLSPAGHAWCERIVFDLMRWFLIAARNSCPGAMILFGADNEGAEKDTLGLRSSFLRPAGNVHLGV